MSPEIQDDQALFANAPPAGVQRWLGLLEPRQLHVVRRALLVTLIGWLPIILLTFAQGLSHEDAGIRSLLLETSVHARYLVAAPLLIIAELQCAQRLGAIVYYFVDSGLVPEHRRADFDRAVASTRRWLDSAPAELAVFVLAYLVSAVSALSYAPEQIPVWHRSDGLLPAYSAAGWWHVLVSLPLLLVLILGWLWRLALWARLLWLISRLDLRVIASHPDKMAGLGFVGHSVSAFSVAGLALASIAAGRSAHLVLVGGSLPTPALTFNAGFLIFLMALVLAPLLVMTPLLVRAWQQGTMEYGALAARVGETFEDKWIDHRRGIDRSTLGSPDFSTAANIYSVASNAYAIRFVPVDFKNLVVLAVALLLPFLPVVLLAIPIETILASLQKLLF